MFLTVNNVAAKKLTQFSKRHNSSFVTDKIDTKFQQNIAFLIW